MTADPVEWARAEAENLKEAVPSAPRDRVSPWRLAPQTAAALEFLRTQATGSHFYKDAESIFASGHLVYANQVFPALAGVLEQWAEFVEAGLAALLPYEAQARVDAATDLMEQVQLLLADPKMHEAAPVVLAGAALEEFLRSRVAATGATVAGKPGINTYANALKAAGDLSTQDVKDITSWAGQRNDAAHGQFDDLSKDRAKIMVDSINLFMRQKTVTTP